MTDEPAPSLQARVESESALPYCSPDDLDVVLCWQAADDGSLRGTLAVTNTGPTACRVGGKPVVTPLGLDGTPLPAQTVVTMEQRVPSWVVVPPGAEAAAAVGWGGWCGDAASGRARVRWEQGEATVTIAGPAQPHCPAEGHPVSLWSSWFALVDGGAGERRAGGTAPSD